MDRSSVATAELDSGGKDCDLISGRVVKALVSLRALMVCAHGQHLIYASAVVEPKDYARFACHGCDPISHHRVFVIATSGRLSNFDSAARRFCVSQAGPQP